MSPQPARPVPRTSPSRPATTATDLVLPPSMPRTSGRAVVMPRSRLTSVPMVQSPPMPILWDEACALPATLSATLDRREGFDGVIAHLADPGVRRIVATGNGAAYY